MVTIGELRAAFPAPAHVVNSLGDDGHSYCVGSACVHAAGLAETYGPRSARFPSATVLSHALRVLNTQLSPDMALWSAGMIISSNDIERFEDAWAYVEHALGYASGSLAALPYHP